MEFQICGLRRSGESGSGKTETAKIVMQYLAAVVGDSGIGNEVLHTNTILESFGNAKTSINENSSRFGKRTEIHFSSSGRICGAYIQTFLLEKSRVVKRAKGERSYHIFYQLCAGAPPLLKEKLDLREANEFEYLKQSGCLKIDGVDDAQRFQLLLKAFDIVHISKEDREHAFTMMAAVLWLGNIAFSVINDENHVEVVQDEGVTNAAKLIGCKDSDLMLALSTQKVHVDNDSIVQKLTLSQAIDSRDALARSIYACLFDWLVECINKSLEVGKSHEKIISILDIYGFESFQKNSFEQLCINYANDRLQQHINRQLFKLEQEEYIQDGIDWTSVDFVDNVECLNMFEKKPLGLFSLLEVESTYSKATDLTLAKKFKKHLSDNSCFKGERGGAFKVCHYAGEVLYHTNGFLEKNRDSMHSDSIQQVLSCCHQLPESFISHVYKSSQKQSVGTKFKGHLFKLMKQLEVTSPHFIQCIKPNNEQLPGLYVSETVSRQLRCCGVLEVVRLPKLGYQTRMTHQQFSERYGILLLDNVECQEPLSVSVTILKQFNIQPEMYQVGYTKLFFRKGQITTLEDARNHTIKGILWAQKCIRGLWPRRYYQDLKKGATILQSYIRGEMERREFQMRRCTAQDTFTNQKDTVIFSGNTEKVSREPGRSIQQTKVQALDFEDIQWAKRKLSQKEEENAMLQQQIQQFEKRWSEYETVIKTKEEMWMKQMTSLQMSLAAAKKCMTDASPIRTGYDSESAISAEFHTPEYTPPRKVRASDADDNQGPIGLLAKEFEQQCRVFEDETHFLAQVKSGDSADSGLNPDEELRKLKVRFTAWKKEYKVRLRNAKAVKVGGEEGTKARWTWWSKRFNKT